MSIGGTFGSGGIRSGNNTKIAKILENFQILSGICVKCKSFGEKNKGL